MKSRFTHLLGAAGLLLPLAAHAQTTGSVGIGTTTPDPAAALDISSAGKGLLIPRLDSASRASIPTPPTGLMVFQTDGRQGFWYYGGGQWLYLPDKTRTGDNLGSHRATQNLDLGTHQLVGNGGTGGLGIDRNGRVGVGTATPQTPLHVLSPTYDVATFATNLGAGPHLLLERDSSHAVIDYIGLNTSNGGREGALELRGNTSVQISGDGDVSYPDLTVLANGNVGVGFADPQHKLQVDGQVYAAGGYRFSDNTVQTTAAAPDNLGNHSATRNLGLNDFDLRLRAASGAGNGLGWYGLSGGTKNWLNQDIDGPVLYGASGGGLGTNGSSRTLALAWTSQARVGIGTTAPATRLSITPSATEAKITLWDGGNATTHYGFGVSGGQLNYHVDAAAASHVFYAGGKNGDGAELVRIRGNGRVGIGTNDPQQALDVNGTARATNFSYNAVQTRYLTLPIAAFVPDNPAAYTLSAAFGNISGAPIQSWLQGGTAGQAGYVMAPVNLPQGAVLTGLTLLAYDADGTSVAPQALLTVSQPLIGTTTSNAFYYQQVALTAESPNFQSVTQSLPAHTVQNDQFFYQVRVRLNQNSNGTQLLGVRIAYTITQPE